MDGGVEKAMGGLKNIGTEKSIIMDYEQVLLGKKKAISLSFFSQSDAANKMLAIMVLRYAVKELLNWSPEEFQVKVTKELLDKLKVWQVVKYIPFPPELEPKKDLFYLALAAFPGLGRYDWYRETIRTYGYVAISKRRARYPKNFFDGSEGKYRACFCLRYCMSNYMQFLSVEDVYITFSTRQIRSTLRTWKLEKALVELFDSNPVAFVDYALPTKNRDDFYYYYYSLLYISREDHPEISQGVKKAISNAKAIGCASINLWDLKKCANSIKRLKIKAGSFRPKKELLIEKASSTWTPDVYIFFLWLFLTSDLPDINNPNYEEYAVQADTRDLIKNILSAMIRHGAEKHKANKKLDF